jgi:hypothetical protein
METPIEEQGRAASRWRKTGRPEHGSLVLAFRRSDKAQVVDKGVFDNAAGGRLIIEKARNLGEETAPILVGWGSYSQWAYVWFPERETL